MFYPTEEYSYENVKNFVNTTNESTYELITTKEQYTHHSKTKLTIKHIPCGNIFEVDCHHFVKANNRCPNCNKAKYFSKKTEEEFKKDVFNTVGDEYTVVGKYINKETKIELRHNICGNIYTVTPGHFLNTGCRCTFCKQGSRGETAVKHILEENKINFIREFRFEKLFNEEKNCRLEFDFAIFRNDKLICLIEYDGPQHEKPTKIWGVSDEEAERRFQRQIINDKIKNDFCNDNNIPLLRIPYNKYRTMKKIKEKMDKEFLGRFNDYPELEYTKNQKF